ncbi:MAG: 3-deoxy-manno-octulosonate cytidylyltransferase [Candidatus Latescibacteria bacterium]|nr:3-deoxy-manno-octulosonate cytidylyltransferase [Candidatus Latescibacterota bacterium]
MGIIPARLHSTRLPEKALQDLGGAPLIVRVMERVRQAAAIRKVWVATDSPRIAEAVRSAGGDVIMTRAELPSGLDRVAEAAREVGDEIIVNIQGDEPFVSPAGLAHLVSLFEDPNARIATLAAPFPPASDPSDPNRVKVVLDRAGRALYFSRSPIPHGAGGDLPALLHVGVYAYRRETLLDLARFGPCPLERAEGLEQLRALWHGIPIHVAVGSYGSLGIDTPEDLDRARLQYGTRRETR